MEFLVISGAIALLITIANHIMTRPQIQVEQWQIQQLSR